MTTSRNNLDRAQPAPLLEFFNLRLAFSRDGHEGLALAGVSMTLAAGERLALAGESGSGKSLLALAACGLLSRPATRIKGGNVLWEGEDILTLPESRLTEMRGREFCLIMQDPSTALNPLWTTGFHITETDRTSRAQRRKSAIQRLTDVGIHKAESIVDSWPHQLSGGMKQRVAIAAALGGLPRLLIADEPTTALDATVQHRVLTLLDQLVEEHNTALLLITHDLAVASRRTQRIAILYSGLVMEEGPTNQVLQTPHHPYTVALRDAVPRPDRPGLPEPIPGTPPSIFHRPSGCPFHPRCIHCLSECREITPDLREISPGRKVRCHLQKGG